MKIFIQTLGCKVNQYESQALASMLERLGHEICDEPDGADAVCINTCAVTAKAVQKSRQCARQALSKAAPGARLILCGCWSQTEPENAAKLSPAVLFGSGDRAALAQAIHDMDRGGTVQNIDQPFRRRTFEALPAGSTQHRSRALLKIEDGCVNFCSYCVIPYARGAVLSLPMEDAKRAAADLEAQGFREIVMTGIEIASYGRDLPGHPTLEDVTCAVCDAAPRCRIHLGSLEPRCVTEEFCENLAKKPNLLPHFHLSLQSGCDATLSRMKRRYDTSLFYSAVERLRRHFPNCGITADLITGFPGETEEEFSQTLEFIEKCAFSAMHVFPYSVRKGTPAAGMEQLTRKVKEDRARVASALAADMKAEFLSRQVGRTLHVLFEEQEGGLWQGHSENYLVVQAEGTDLRGRILPVLITEAGPAALRGVVTETN